MTDICVTVADLRYGSYQIVEKEYFKTVYEAKHFVTDFNNAKSMSYNKQFFAKIQD